MFSTERDYHREKCIMRLNVTFYEEGEEIKTSLSGDPFYDCVCTDLLGNKLDDNSLDVIDFEQRSFTRSFKIKKNMLVFDINSFAGDLSFDYNYSCGLECEHENIGVAEILGIDETDGLYYLVKDIVPLLKNYIKKAKKNKRPILSKTMEIPTLWTYESWIYECHDGYEGDSRWDYLGILDLSKLDVLDINGIIGDKGIDIDMSKFK
jgi:hypothetical protein